ncbi:hypothetical protein [Janthinobacterium sp. RT4P48]
MDQALRAPENLAAAECSEQVLLVWDGELAGQWLHAVARQLAIHPN